MDRLKGKVAVVTGAAQGIGATYAKALAAEGAAVVVTDIAEPRETAVAITAAGGKALALACDVTDAKALAAMVQQTVAKFGGVHVLINNAALFGKLALKPFEQIDSAEWDAVMAVNVRGVFECCKAVLPQMRAQGYGKIINVASGTVFKGTPMLLHYVTSKGAVIALTRCVAREVGDAGIRVNCIAPGLTMSDSVRTNPAWADAIITANTASRAIKREATPDDMVGTVIYLAAPDSDFLTGQTIVVDGGSAMH